MIITQKIQLKTQHNIQWIHLYYFIRYPIKESIIILLLVNLKPVKIIK